MLVLFNKYVFAFFIVLNLVVFCKTIWYVDVIVVVTVSLCVVTAAAADTGSCYTSGVGTTSYAAPEQLNSCCYNIKVR